MKTDCEITIEKDGVSKVYDDSNTNWYQKVLLLMIRQERELLKKMEENKRRPEDLIKQLGVVEWFVRQIPIYDSIHYINHLFGPTISEASRSKHE